MKKDTLPIPFKAINLEINGKHLIADITKLELSINAYEKYLSTGIFNAKITILYRDIEKAKKVAEEAGIKLSHYVNLMASYQNKKNMFHITPVSNNDGILYGAVNCQSNISVGYLNQNTLVDTDYGLLVVSGDTKIVINFKTEELNIEYILRNQISFSLMKKNFKLAEMRVIK